MNRVQANLAKADLENFDNLGTSGTQRNVMQNSHIQSLILKEKCLVQML